MIPIKLNNERVPNKNLKRFYDGKPLIEFIQQSTIKTKSINEVYIYCSDETIVKFAIKGVKVLIRPKYLDEDKSNANDIFREFMKVIDADIYVIAHATSPFTRSTSIETCIQQVVLGNYDSAFLAKKMQEFLWRNNEPLNFDVQNFPRTQDLDPIYSETSGAFVFTKNTFLNHNRRVGIKPYIHEVDAIEAIDIDYPIDFEIANAIYRGILKNENIDK